MGLEGAVNIIYKAELDAIADTEERAATHKLHLAHAYHPITGELIDQVLAVTETGRRSLLTKLADTAVNAEAA